MIFSGDLADKVLDGTKTQTRRPVKWETPLRVKPCQYRVGATYAIQRKRGTFGIGPRIRVLAVRQVYVAAIDEVDAVAEGFAGVDEFLERWRSFYGSTSGLCWRIEFELVPGEVQP